MKNRRFLASLALFLGVSLTTGPALADLKTAKEVEAQKVHFEPSSFKLSPDAKLILDQAVVLMARMNESYSIKVMGFTDSSGAEDLNQSLSVQRANAVTQYLVSKGIEEERILIQGRGWNDPVASNDTEEGRNLNRRVEFKFINPDTTDLKLTASTAGIVPAPADQPKEEEVLSIQPAETPAAKQEEVKMEEPAPPPAPAAPTKEVKVEKAPDKVEEEPVEHEEVMAAPERRHDTMLVAEKKKRKTSYNKDHVYEDRKRGDQGQAYAQISPVLTTIDGARNLGAANDDFDSQLSFKAELGWTSFLEDDNSSFFAVKGYGSFIRVDNRASNLVTKSQKQLPFGGELALGRYFNPSVFIQIQSGYGKELTYHLAGGSIEFDTDYIWHAGLSTEVIAWRFSREGDLGVDAFFNYYDFGKGTLDSGSIVGMSLFADYDFFRAGFGFTKMKTETTGFKFNTWQFGPNFRLYF